MTDVQGKMVEPNEQTCLHSSSELGQERRRGSLKPGDRVQITDPKGRLHTIVLVDGGKFQTNRGTLFHNQVLGGPDAQVVNVGEGKTFQVIRPLLSDYVLSMPRGAAIIYPKDAAQIVQMGDIFPGATVLEAGVGSGALSLSLLNAVGQHGRLHSVEKREDFAKIAEANVDLWFGGRHPGWTLQIEDVGSVLSASEDDSYDRVILDLLDPWSYAHEVARVLRPGGVLITYVTTVPQLSRTVETLDNSKLFTKPASWESINRTWHVEGLSVRPDHRMFAHTGYLMTARRLAANASPHRLAARPAPAAKGRGGQWDDQDEWTDTLLGTPKPSDKKVRRVRKDLEARVDHWLPEINKSEQTNVKEM